VADAIECELHALENATGIESKLAVDGDLNELSDSQKIVLFRVVQEALSNVRKHSEAKSVSVVLRSKRTFVDVSVVDDGRGFDPRGLGHDRLGLAGISERVRLLGGAVEIETSPGAGTTVRATLPQWRPSSPAGATVYAATS
jgi:signal transduction histidine kinase